MDGKSPVWFKPDVSEQDNGGPGPPIRQATDGIIGMTSIGHDTLKTRRTLTVGGKAYDYFSLPEAAKTLGDISRLPVSLKVLLENVLRFEDGRSYTVEDAKSVAGWLENASSTKEVPFKPARILMQDFTGVPAVVDLAAMRDGIIRLGGDPAKVNPLVPVDLVIDHSIQIDVFGTADAPAKNEELEFERNGERYRFLRWGQDAFNNFRVVPPGTGICHQVNLEYLSQVVWTSTNAGTNFAYPDTLYGTDSHTTMVNGLGVLGWGVGGIEAEAAMLGQPIAMLIPDVIGFKLTGTAARRSDGHRSRADCDTNAPAQGRGRQVRGILRTGPGESGAARPRHDRQHGAGVWRDLRLFPGR